MTSPAPYRSARAVGLLPLVILLVVGIGIASIRISRR